MCATLAYHMTHPMLKLWKLKNRNINIILCTSLGNCEEGLHRAVGTSVHLAEYVMGRAWGSRYESNRYEEVKGC